MSEEERNKAIRRIIELFKGIKSILSADYEMLKIEAVTNKESEKLANEVWEALK